jgi:hypothetical protein
MPFAEPSVRWESPAHRWCDPVQWALRAHCNGQRGRSVPVASSGLVPSQAVSRRLRPSSTVPVMGASCSCSESDEREAVSTLI